MITIIIDAARKSDATEINLACCSSVSIIFNLYPAHAILIRRSRYSDIIYRDGGEGTDTIDTRFIFLKIFTISHHLRHVKRFAQQLYTHYSAYSMAEKKNGKVHQVKILPPFAPPLITHTKPPIIPSTKR